MVNTQNSDSIVITFEDIATAKFDLLKYSRYKVEMTERYFTGGENNITNGGKKRRNYIAL